MRASAGLLAAFLVLLAAPAAAQSLNVAVAANFRETFLQLAADFEDRNAIEVKVSAGSTGMLAAQIRNGAPFQLFLAADAERPRRLEAAAVGIGGTRLTYAIGRLALWAPQAQRPVDGEALLAGGDFRRLAIANPRLAPYGAAARAALRHAGHWQAYRGRVVTGESVAQAYQFVASGNAEIGLVALAQLLQSGVDAEAYWRVPAGWHPAIEQQMLLIEDTPAARSLWRYLQTPAAARIIEAAGYAVVEANSDP